METYTSLKKSLKIPGDTAKKRLTLDKLEEGEFWDHWNVEFTIPLAR